VLQAIGVLLPLNLAALALTAERGVLTPPGLARFALILGQLALVAILDREAAGAAAALLHTRLLRSGCSRGARSPTPPCCVLRGRRLMAAAQLMAPTQRDARSPGR